MFCKFYLINSSIINYNTAIPLILSIMTFKQPATQLPISTLSPNLLAEVFSYLSCAEDERQLSKLLALNKNLIRNKVLPRLFKRVDLS